MRKVFLDNLPKNKTKINWRESVGNNVNFVYDDISGFVTIIDYYISNSGKQQYITLQYENNTYNISTQRFKHADLHALLSYRTYKIIPFKYEIGQRIYDIHRDLTIIDRYVDFSKKKDKKYYKYICSKCGYKDGIIEEYHLSSGMGCSCCAGKIVVEGINDIPTTANWMIPYFQGGYDDAKMYTCSSNSKIFFKCPNCETMMKNKMSIANLYTHKRINCPVCSDGYSSISKYFYNLLVQLKELKQIDDFEMEKKFLWCSFYNPFVNKIAYGLYDFVIESKKLIIEIDGGFHRKPREKSKMSLEETKYRDKQKDILAENNGYTIIRISDEENIQLNILHSNFANIFNLSKIDWNRCLECSLHTYTKDICCLKYEHPDYSISDIRKIYPFSETAIRAWLKIGTKLGWCKYDPKKEIQKGLFAKRMLGSYEEKPVICLDNGETFKSISECARKSLDICGISLSRKCISMVCNNKRLHTGGYHFKFISDLTDEEYTSFNIQNNLNINN